MQQWICVTVLVIVSAQDKILITFTVWSGVLCFQCRLSVSRPLPDRQSRHIPGVWKVLHCHPPPAASASPSDKLPANECGRVSIIIITCRSSYTKSYCQALFKTGRRGQQTGVRQGHWVAVTGTPVCCFLSNTGCSFRVLWLVRGRRGSSVLCGHGRGRNAPLGKEEGNRSTSVCSLCPTSPPSPALCVWLGAAPTEARPNPQR